MKQIKLYSKDIVRVCKYALVSMMFFMGVIPALAQDESEMAVEDAPTAQVKKIKKPVKNYPMKEVKGKVVDAATGEPLAGVQIKSYNNSFYTAMTNEEGVYTIKVPTFVTSLEATLQGYNKVRTAINDRSENVDIQLLTERYLPDYELVTRGSKKVGITDFETTTNMTIDDEIRDRLGADVRSISRSALNAQGSAMFINGLNSLNSNAQPLIVLDGVVYDMLYDSEMIHLGYFNNLLASINMDDIESVEVLKNGTAIYGAKAANGVILINTKRNKSMATRIDFNASVGVELLPKTMDVMNASEYRAYASQMLQSTATKLNEFKFLNTDPNYYYYNMYHNDTDWKDISYKEALTQNYSLHIQGGDDVANYNLSVGYTDAAATLRKNDMNRFNIRFNTDIVLNRWFSTRFDAMYTNITRNLRDAGMESKLNTSAIAATNTLALIKSPFVSPYDFSTDGKVSSFIADADDYLNEVLGSKASLANPKAILENAEAKNKNHVDMTQVGITIAPTWEPTKNFSLTERFSYMLQSFDERYYS
ncbi:MAG: TonB-dependent receptor plug domain-containing protein, partial [Bacteroidaceae bacterium]|nr:TonB-dependent receptor plug domain-containing protein [Bacteroidaceae bacterium]